MNRRIPVVRQTTASDCGPAALAMVLAYHGRPVPLAELRERVVLNRSGATVDALLRAATSYGLHGRAVRVDLDELDHVPRGAILHWAFRHFLVLDSLRAHTVRVVDPAAGRRSVTRQTFGRDFTGVALIFEPTAEPIGRRQPRRAGVWPFLKEVLQFRGLIAQLLALTALAQLVAAALPLITGVLIDRVVPRQDYSFLTILATGYLALQLFAALLAFVRARLDILFRTQLESRLTLRFLDHLVNLPWSFFQRRTSGDLMTRLGSNTAIRSILSSTVLSTILDGLMASVYLVLLLMFNPTLTLAVVAMAAARIALMGWQRRKQRRYLDESLELQARSQTLQVEMLNSMEFLKSMGLERRVAAAWTDVFIEALNVSVARGKLDAWFAAAFSGLGTVTQLLLMFYSVYLVLEGVWSLGSMMAFNALATGFLGPLNGLVSSVLQFQQIEVYLDKVNDVLGAQPETSTTHVITTAPLSGALAFESVSFRYNPSDRLVLNGVSFALEPGCKLAVIGPTGSGKSTLARLITGLFDPEEGQVLIDGCDLRRIERRWLRAQLGIVTQDTQLFGGSIRRNIAMSDPQMTIDRVIGAAKLACIHDEISAMPLGYETTLSDRGLSLSGGQRQRLAIARAVAAHPRILILDEATSHLDTATEVRVSGNISALGCTTIVIAHRLSTIKTADFVIALDEGRIVAEGTYEHVVGERSLSSEALSR